MKYVALLRGINVGGKNKVSMAALKKLLEDLSYSEVKTYINSGNVLLSSNKSVSKIAREIEECISDNFKIDSDLIKTLVISETNYKSIVQNAPKGFGDEPEKYHSDVLFLMDSSKSVVDQFELHPDVDAIWEGKGVLYFRRLSAMRTKSRLSKITAKPVYKSMTIRSWNTAKKLQELL